MLKGDFQGTNLVRPPRTPESGWGEGFQGRREQNTKVVRAVELKLPAGAEH